MGMMHPGGMYPVEPHISSLSNPDFDFSGFRENFVDQVAPLYQVPSQQSINIRQILHDFDPVRQLLFRFDAYGTVAEVTLSLIEKDPSGPVTKAVQALGQLHKQRMRVSQGIELDTKPNRSPADYFHQEALTQLKSNKELQQHLNESDAVAALYLVFFSQLSGCVTDWDEPFAILSDWLIQRRLPVTEEPWLVFQDMSAGERLVVKGALWIDIIASVTTGRGPKFFSLWRRLLGERGTYWGQNHTTFQRGLRMDTLIGCPDEVLLMILEVSLLAQWKATTQHEGILSYRELIRQGNEIEQRMKQNVTDTRLINDNNVSLIQNEMMSKPEMLLDDDTRGAVATLFREAAILYLNTVLSGPCPGVPEISEGVRKITQIIRSLHRSPEVERGAVLPIILAGCMTNDSIHREFFKGRFLQNEGVGNLMQLRVLMEILWQKRDANIVHGSVSLAHVVQEQGLRLLLV
ncbi:hypothetical protein AGABI2DRAFT_201001 [Agaricus bisporus var. bisporus H97]|uniref:hypothetical protein n=1 Tax=Agaricus bisporus var. bisporus (strain H97 / ATCC MYA-4626 / FGSC 10389) TaxID=936046 RepID=UPI00029F6D92|nr:hypothetical protein AGABI2DRAFT_201001 [Agaricus bisporus var. bisporus H97]EKV48980.1 hypothetical protein AGABI2DRAFT_201001 [Agaricus bisporus var. bisporus H97]